MAGMAGARARGRFAATSRPVNARQGADGAKEGGQGAYRPSGLYLFVPHPGCCPLCHTYGLTPHVSRTPDVAFITHPNCLCATIEVPADIAHDWNAIVKWAKRPYGRMRFGWNYGQSLRTVDMTPESSDGLIRQWQQNVANGSWRRAEVSEAQKQKIRDMVKAGELSKQKMVDAAAKAREAALKAGRKWRPGPNKKTKAGLGRSRMLPSARATASPKAKVAVRSPEARLTGGVANGPGLGGAVLLLGLGAAAAKAKESYRKEREARRRKAEQERRRLGYL